MSFVHDSAIAGASGNQGGYRVERSLRFNSSDSAYLSRTPASAGNRKTWTWSGWVKRSGLGNAQKMVAWGVPGTGECGWTFEASNVVEFYQFSGSYQMQLVTAQVFRDVSAWFHVVMSVDTTQATASDRVKLYINGTQITNFSTASYPTQNLDTYANSTSHTGYIGVLAGQSNYFNGYLADIHFIDGQALDPTSFGEFDTNGVWQPKAYTGTYGTNGFHLPFSDNSTAAALGTDTSGNGNDWTPNNLSVTAGTGRYVGATTGSLFNGAWINVFNGSISPVDSTNWAYTYSATTSLTLAEALTGTVEVYATRPGSSNSGTHTITLSTGSSVTLTSAANNNPQWYSFGSQTNVTSITVVGGDPGIAILAVRVNGVILIDKQFGAGNDSLVDTPTSYGTDTGAGGEVRGNYCTLNSLTLSNGTLSNGNLDYAANGNNSTVWSTVAINTGKWYWEVTKNGGDMALMLSQEPRFNGFQPEGTATGLAAYMYYNQGSSSENRFAYNGTNYAFPTGFGDDTNGTIYSFMLDFDNNTFKVRRNNDSGTEASFSIPSALKALPLHIGYSVATTWPSASFTYNFGQRPFAYTAPSGFKALCDTNLPAPVVAKPNTVMGIATYSGNNGSNTLTTGVDASTYGGLLWIKNRSTTAVHNVLDDLRGYTNPLELPTTAAEYSFNPGLTPTSTGYTLNTGSGQYNASGSTYVAWHWAGGTSTVTNTDGSITSQVRANASAGFSIVTYTGNGTASTIGHGLGVAPSLIIVKSRSNTGDWPVYTSMTGAGNKLYLNLTDASAGSSNWNSTAPTSTVFSVGSGGVETNINTYTYVAYCFAPVAGYSAFGSYVGNFSTDGPFVYTGFRPRWVMYKRSDLADTWAIVDSARDPINVTGNFLYPNLSNGEAAAPPIFDFVSNGFKVRRATDGTNANGGTFIWAAFAESPFAYSRAR